MFANWSNKLMVLENESSEPIKIIVVSAAYCESLQSVVAILIPRISLSFLTALPKTSAHKIKDGEIVGPPLSRYDLNLKNPEEHLLF